MLAVLMIGAAIAALGLELLLGSHFGTELRERIASFVTALTRRNRTINRIRTLKEN